MRAIMYVDGSFKLTCSVGETLSENTAVGIYGSGVYLMFDGMGEPIEISFAGADIQFAKLRNVAGELMAVTQTLAYIQKSFPQIDELYIYYDYAGIEKWVTGEWTARNAMTIAYRELLRKAQKTMRIKFLKVAAHSGVIYNERADRLAKNAIDDYVLAHGLL